MGGVFEIWNRSRSPPAGGTFMAFSSRSKRIVGSRSSTLGRFSTFLSRYTGWNSPFFEFDDVRATFFLACEMSGPELFPGEPFSGPGIAISELSARVDGGVTGLYVGPEKKLE